MHLKGNFSLSEKLLEGVLSVNSSSETARALPVTLPRLPARCNLNGQPEVAPQGSSAADEIDYQTLLGIGKELLVVAAFEVLVEGRRGV